ncbi:MAG: hypothetical protein ACTHOG_03190 [Marmoricola sp.]
MHTHLRPDVLRLVCAELPASDASWIRSLPADELTTHLEAYSVLRRMRIRLPADLEQEFLRCVLEQMTCHKPDCQGGGRSTADFQRAAAGWSGRPVSSPSALSVSAAQ